MKHARPYRYREWSERSVKERLVEWATQTPARQVDDNEIHSAVKARLTAARFSNIVNININVTNGVVTLAGEVPHARVKADAEAEARAVNGVVRVHNELQVKNPPSN